MRKRTLCASLVARLNSGKTLKIRPKNVFYYPARVRISQVNSHDGGISEGKITGMSTEMIGHLTCVVDAVSWGLSVVMGNVTSDHNAFMVMLPVVMNRLISPI